MTPDWLSYNECAYVSVCVCVCVVGCICIRRQVFAWDRFVPVFVAGPVHFWILHNLWFVRCDFHCDCQKHWQTVSAKLRFTSIRLCSLCGCASLRLWFGVCFNLNCLFLFLLSLLGRQCILMNWIENRKDSDISRLERIFSDYLIGCRWNQK